MDFLRLSLIFIDKNLIKNNIKYLFFKSFIFYHKFYFQTFDINILNDEIFYQIKYYKGNFSYIKFDNN